MVYGPRRPLAPLRRPWGLLFGALLLPAHLSTAGAEERALTVWLMPAEEAGPNAPVGGAETRREIREFNDRLVGRHITVLNTQPPLDAQLVVRNPQFAVVNWSWISNQLQTLDAIDRFAAARSMHVNVRFVTWDEAFEELRSYQATGPMGPPPDVAQIGTTWSGYFAAAGLLSSRPGAAGNWRSVRNHRATALPYVNDVRLLFYWKRRLSQPPSAPPFQLDDASWESIIRSFQAHAENGDSIALAAGLTLNLLHDYASFVWAGGGKLMSAGFRDHVDLTSPGALRVPLLLTRSVHPIDPNAGPRQTVSFPEAPHEEVSRLFVNDAYRATLEPVDFISRWYIDFSEKENQKLKQNPTYAVRSFWDYAAVLAPPAGFRGGSELVVMRRTGPPPEEAFNLAEFLATDPAYTQMLAHQGHLPSLRVDFGLDLLVGNLTGKTPSEGADAFQRAAKKAILKDQSYPDIDSFPTVLESKEALESLQTVWRRMSFGDTAAVRAAAKETEFLLNSRIDWLVRLENELQTLLPFILAAIVAGVCVYVGVLHVRNEQRLAVLLYHASLHAALPSYGIRLIDCAAEVRRGRITPADFLEQVEKYARHLSGAFYNHTASLAGALGSEMQGLRVPMGACELARKAKDGADVQFQGVWMDAPPALPLEVGPCNEWSVAKLPNLAMVILQEWLYNTLKRVSSNEAADGGAVSADPKVTISVDSGGFHIDTPLPLKTSQIETLQAPPERVIDLTFGGMGLRIIVNLLWLGYRRRLRLEYSDAARGTRVTFPFPMARQPRGAAKGSK